MFEGWSLYPFWPPVPQMSLPVGGLVGEKAVDFSLPMRWHQWSGELLPIISPEVAYGHGGGGHMGVRGGMQSWFHHP